MHVSASVQCSPSQIDADFRALVDGASRRHNMYPSSLKTGRVFEITDKYRVGDVRTVCTTIRETHADDNDVRVCCPCHPHILDTFR